VADRAGITRVSVSNIERGHQGVSVTVLCALADALGVGVGDLLVPHAATSCVECRVLRGRLALAEGALETIRDASERWERG